MANLFFYFETISTNDFCQVFYKHSSFHHGQAKITFCKREQYRLLMAFFISIYIYQFSYFHDHVSFGIKFYENNVIHVKMLYKLWLPWIILILIARCQLVLYSYIFKVLLYFLYLPKISYISSQKSYIFPKLWEKKLTL